MQAESSRGDQREFQSFQVRTCSEALEAHYFQRSVRSSLRPQAKSKIRCSPIFDLQKNFENLFGSECVASMSSAAERLKLLSDNKDRQLYEQDARIRQLKSEKAQLQNDVGFQKRRADSLKEQAMENRQIGFTQNIRFLEIFQGLFEGALHECCINTFGKLGASVQETIQGLFVQTQVTA